MTAVKICGITDLAALQAAVSGGAVFTGFVFHPPSPRHLSPDKAAVLLEHVPEKVVPVGLFVDPADEELKTTLAQANLRMVQLHGGETPERVKEIRALLNLPVMKAISVADKKDLASVAAYSEAADWLLFDAKPNPGAALPGGNGAAFDWTVLRGLKPGKPWMLAGGLTAENVKDALKILSPDVVDVSSGVESAPGKKDPALVRRFIETVRA